MATHTFIRMDYSDNTQTYPLDSYFTQFCRNLIIEQGWRDIGCFPVSARASGCEEWKNPRGLYLTQLGLSLTNLYELRKEFAAQTLNLTKIDPKTVLGID